MLFFMRQSGARQDKFSALILYLGDSSSVETRMNEFEVLSPRSISSTPSRTALVAGEGYQL